MSDVSSPHLANTRLAKSVLDGGWGVLKTMLLYEGQQARCSTRQRDKHQPRLFVMRVFAGTHGANGFCVRR
jgi:hypothetical protein